MKEKLKAYLTNYFSSVYCHTCAMTRDCESCHRKNMNWSLSEDASEIVADEIIKIMKGD